jgi:hypothetical protein
MIDLSAIADDGKESFAKEYDLVGPSYIAVSNHPYVWLRNRETGTLVLAR